MGGIQFSHQNGDSSRHLRKGKRKDNNTQIARVLASLVRSDLKNNHRQIAHRLWVAKQLNKCLVEADVISSYSKDSGEASREIILFCYETFGLIIRSWQDGVALPGCELSEYAILLAEQWTLDLEEAEKLRKENEVAETERLLVKAERLVAEQRNKLHKGEAEVARLREKLKVLR
jgi:hypothetical protein